MAAMEHGVKLSQTSPAFLHANSTSHTWIFSAFAELIDNAYDPDVNASELYIDKRSIHGKECLVFTDNGNGMNPDKLHKMLSFGYCEKVEINGHKPVGHYGNGFKSGSMRMGKDAIVFTKDKHTMSVGFLSQSYLENISAKTVLVPIVTFEKNTLSVRTAKDTKGSLDAITKHSLFRSHTDLILEFQALDQFPTGTRIIMYNLNRGADNKLELDFTSNQYDVINSEHQALDMTANYRPWIKEYQPEYRRSLREYCSILYLKPRMKIILRGKKVKTQLISQSLSRTEKDVYKPLWLNKAVKITFGFSNNNQDYGVMMYHRNRLIKAYERVGYQKQANQLGVGVVGVVSVNFLEPIHNKQDFNKTDRYNATMNALAQKLNDYWNEKNNVIDIEAEEVVTKNDHLPPDWTWAQCDNCLKWRRMPLGSTEKDLPEKWFCYMNPDPIHNRCDVEEEPEDEDELLNRATYEKTYKKYQEKGKQQSMKKIEEREKQLRIQEKELRVARRQIEDIRQAQEVTSSEDKKPSVDELVIALEEARKREAEQKKIIEQLKQTKEQVIQNQQRLSEVVANEAASLANLNKQSQKIIEKVQPQSSKQVSSTSSLNKRKSSFPEAVPGKRVCMRDSEFIVTANDEEEEDDNVIVLGSDDEDNGTNQNAATHNNTDNASEVDIKPDVEQLNKEMQLQQTDATQEANDTSTAVNGEVSQEDVSANNMNVPENITDGNESGMLTEPSSDRSVLEVVNSVKPPPQRPNASANRRPVPSPRASQPPATLSRPSAQRTPPRMTVKFPFRKQDEDRTPAPVRTPAARPVAQKQHKSVQTVKMEEEEESEDRQKLNHLREHVSQLLAIIAPEVDLGNLENIDDIVREMIRVNSSQNDSDDDDEDSD